MTLEEFLWIVLIFLVGGTFVLFFAFLPHKIVQLQGRFYRRVYKTYRKMTDEEIDSMYQLPTARFFMGVRSEFVR